MERKNADIEKLSNSDRMYIVGFDSAIKVFSKTINELESSEIEDNMFFCSEDSVECIKGYIKHYLLEKLNEFRGYVIAEMIVGHGNNERN